mmetsp:Transcript_1947/g.5785  ORF Transcript_1947/g.5785 Transcript_1947/m.5785 type:complete len:200 (+) Transcript_1947:372-971(+)
MTPTPSSEVHTAHAAHAAHAAAARGRRRVRLWQVDDHALGGSHERRHRGGVHQRGAAHLRRVDDAGADEVGVRRCLRVVPKVCVRGLEQLAHDHGALGARVGRDGLAGDGEGRLHDLDAVLLVEVGGGDALERLGRVEERGAAAGDDALLDGGAGRVERVRDAVFLLAHLGLGRAANLDDRDASRELGEPLLQLLLLVL